MKRAQKHLKTREVNKFLINGYTLLHTLEPRKNHKKPKGLILF